MPTTQDDSSDLQRAEEAREHRENAARTAVVFEKQVVNIILASPGFCAKYLPDGHVGVPITEEHGFVAIGHSYDGKVFASPEPADEPVADKPLELRVAELEAAIETLKARG